MSRSFRSGGGKRGGGKRGGGKRGGGPSGGKKPAPETDMHGQDRSTADQMLYDSDQEDQTGRAVALEANLAKRTSNQKSPVPAPAEGESRRDWNAQYNHERMIRSTSESLASAKSRASDNIGIPHSEEFLRLKRGREDGQTGPNYEASLAQREQVFQAGLSSNTPPAEAQWPSVPPSSAVEMKIPETSNAPPSAAAPTDHRANAFAPSLLAPSPVMLAERTDAFAPSSLSPAPAVSSQPVTSVDAFATPAPARAKPRPASPVSETSSKRTSSNPSPPSPRGGT